MQGRSQVQPRRERRRQRRLAAAGSAADDDDEPAAGGEEARDAAEPLRDVGAQAVFVLNFFFCLFFFVDFFFEKTKCNFDNKKKHSPEFLQHPKQRRLHVLLPDVQHPGVDELLLQGQGGLAGLGRGDQRGRRQRPRDEEAREDVVVPAAAQPDSDL